MFHVKLFYWATHEGIYQLENIFMRLVGERPPRNSGVLVEWLLENYDRYPQDLKEDFGAEFPSGEGRASFARPGVPTIAPDVVPAEQRVASALIYNVLTDIRARYPNLPVIHVIEDENFREPNGDLRAGYTHEDGSVTLNRAGLANEAGVRKAHHRMRLQISSPKPLE